MKTLAVVLLIALIAGCSARPAAPADEHAGAVPAAKNPPPLYGNLGDWHHAISCRGDGAQAYFDQGLRLVYAFNHDEAVRAFAETARRDPACAMAYWGQALALGPNINLPLDPQRAATAYAALREAERLAPGASAEEQAYIAALATRYGADPDADRPTLDRAYADAMGALAAAYPADPDASVLYAEALMDLHPWDLWGLDGQPRPDTPVILATLEGVLATTPNHPGANHYYIHAVEASPHPERAMASAERLRDLVPGAGHLVHMPAHIYMRTGRYAEASDANVRAAAVDEAYIAAQHPEGIYPMMYYPHNLHFFWASATMEGRSADAIRAARAVAAHLTPAMAREMPMLEFYLPTPYFALVRFGHWQDMLAEPAPPADLLYDTAMWHYGRGIAEAATGRYAAAEADLAAIKTLAGQIPAARIVGDDQQAGTMLYLASLSLGGEIAARQHHCETAISTLEASVSVQDGLPYMEPPPWYMPQRQALGAALLGCGRPGAAEQVFREDLRRYPNNGWSLYGLAQSLRAEGDPKGAAEAEAQFRAAWQRADVQLAAATF